MITISIASYKIGSPASPKFGTQFRVNFIQYSAPTAAAHCVLLDAAGVEIMPLGLIGATAAQCSAWSDDTAFAAVLAVNAGFDPAAP